MQSTRPIKAILAATLLVCVAPLALAQSTPANTPVKQDNGMQHPQSGAITHQPMTAATSGMSSAAPQVMGEHTMQGTVESVSASGMVHVDCEGMNLRVHFPGAAKNLKKGDKITLHLGYTRDTG